MIEEKYSNELESNEVNSEIFIYSKSLTDKNTELWSNKFLQITAQNEKEK